jgi:hypothetical protein
MNASLIDGVMLLGVRSGAAAELRMWANTRKTAAEQLAAGLAVAEGMAQYRLGFRPSYPIY